MTQPLIDQGVARAALGTTRMLRCHEGLHFICSLVIHRDGRGFKERFSLHRRIASPPERQSAEQSEQHADTMQHFLCSSPEFQNRYSLYAQILNFPLPK